MKRKIKQRINRINKRLREIRYAIYMYGLDAWGSSAFGNMEKMAALRKEAVTLARRKRLYWFLYKLI